MLAGCCFGQFDCMTPQTKSSCFARAKATSECCSWLRATRPGREAPFFVFKCFPQLVYYDDGGGGGGNGVIMNKTSSIRICTSTPYNLQGRFFESSLEVCML